MYRFCFVLICICGQFSKYKPPREGLYWRGDLTGGFLRYRFGGLVFGGAFFPNFTVYVYKHKGKCYVTSVLKNVMRVVDYKINAR